MKVLVTGAAGFIGFHVARALMQRGDSVVAADILNDYYDVSLKEARLDVLRDVARETNAGFTFHRIDLAHQGAVSSLFEETSFDRVIHLAAQAGVRHSLTDPHAYVTSNLIAFTNLLEACRYGSVGHLTYASTSSVYGANTKLPFSEADGVDHPLQFYAATKRANELMAHAYSHLYRLPTTGLRFFTVYGPWGRPDMALFKFTKAILAGEPIEVFNDGNHSRDFTYIDDIVEGVIRTSDRPAEPDPHWNGRAPDPARSNAPYRIYNIGNGAPAQLGEYISALEEALQKPAIKKLLPLQPGDVPDTYADSSRLFDATGYQPKTSIKVGIERFVAWYRQYYSSI
ncbi:MAG: NAD-dependent epimerase [Pseudomonadota bacterium]